MKLTHKGTTKFWESEKVYDLLHFRRALAEERYEVCGFWARLAEHDGASRPEIDWNISFVLSGHA